MDKSLYERLKKIDDQIGVLKELELDFLKLQAHEKVIYSKIYLSVPGSNVEERKCRAHTHPDWIDFIDGLAVAEAQYLEAKRKYELKLKAYDAEHLTFKNEAPAVRRQP